MDDYDLCSETLTKLQRDWDGLTSRYAKAEGSERSGLLDAVKESYWEAKPALERLQKEAAPADAAQVAEWVAFLAATRERFKELRISLDP